tara:strand:- start:10271 stop:10543 length:273 start_codon:yes stop_codon:yes gene_type:complete
MSYHTKFNELFETAVKKIQEKVEKEGVESLYSYDKAIMIESIAPNSSKGLISEVFEKGFIDSDGHVISFYDVDTEEFFIFCDELFNTRKY